MKKATLFALAITLSTGVFAQLRVHSNGNTQVGPVSISPTGRLFEVIGSEGTIESLTYTLSRDIARHWCANQSWAYSFGIGENNNGYIWGNINSPSNLMTWNSNGHFSMGYSVPNQTYRLAVNGKTTASAFVISSDKRFKINTANLGSVSSEIYKLRGVSYNLKDTLEYKFDNEGVRFGFIAQELQEVFPDLVSEDENGMLGVNYIDLIPLLVEEMKKQNERIDELTDLLNSNSSVITQSGNLLEQNVPNPFTSRTKIKCFVKESYQSAQLILFDMQGNLVQTKEISRSGENEVVFESSELRAGMYLYSLIVDGVEIDTKRMILTE